MFDRPLKILIVLPLYGGSLPIGYYCADALKKLGHHVELFEAPEFLQAHTALRSLNISQEKLNILKPSALLPVRTRLKTTKVFPIGRCTLLCRTISSLFKKSLFYNNYKMIKT